MSQELRTLIGVTLTVAVIATGIFLARALLSKDPETLDREGLSAFDRASNRVRIGFVLVGWLAVVTFGIHGVLNLYFGNFRDAAVSVAGFAAFGTIPVLVAIANLPKLKKDLAFWSATGVWERKQLQSGITPSVGEIENLLAESRDLAKSAHEREIAASKHGFASALRARDELIEAAIVYRLAREEQARRDKVAEEYAAAAKAEAEAAKQAAKKDQWQKLNVMIADKIERLALLDSRQERPHETLTQVVLAHRLSQELWAEFKQHIAEPVPTTPEDAVRTAEALKTRIANLEGVSIPSGFEPIAVFDGNARDGCCNLMMRRDDSAITAYRSLFFSESVPGLVAALFFAAALPHHWSWGHGLYGRDAELVLTLDQLKWILNHEVQGKSLGGAAKWPPPGLRLSRIEGGYEVACLAGKPGRGLFDLSLIVRDGQATELQTHEVFVWGQGVYY